jgi:hypothetical protein
MRHRLVQRVLIQFAFGETDHDAGDSIANQICQRAALAHELVDADQYRVEMTQTLFFAARNIASAAPIFDG